MSRSGTAIASAVANTAQTVTDQRLAMMDRAGFVAAGNILGRTARNVAQIAQESSWTEETKRAYKIAQAEREAAQRALQERQRPFCSFASPSSAR